MPTNSNCDTVKVMVTLLHLFDTAQLMETLKVIGYGGIGAIVFAESGLFFGFFLPGDSLLFAAGILASSGVFSLSALLVIVILAAIVGDSVGYFFGRCVGRKLLKKKNSFFFKRKYLLEAEVFYEKHGPKAIVLGRFIPIVRTFVPIVAGVALMKYGTFLKYNILGGFIWGGGVICLGYLLGTRIPAVEHYLLPIIVIIITVSFLPLLYELLSAQKKK